MRTMKCPACKYHYEYEFSMTKEQRMALPAEGDFFYLNKGMMERNDSHGVFHKRERADLYACPKCGAAFIWPHRNEE